jgi:hypothetical protein
MSSQAKMATATSVTLKPTDIELLVTVCKQFTKIDTKQLATDLDINANAAGMRWTRFKEKTFGKDGNSKVDSVALKQPDIDLLVALVKQFGKVDTKLLAADLGCNANAAGMRWSRFKARAFGKESKDGKQSGVKGDGEGEAKTPKTPKSGKKRGRAEVEDGVDDAEDTPTKKAATKKGARGKKGQVAKAEEHGEVEQIVKGEEATGFGDNDGRLEGSLYYEINGENEDGEVFYEGY